MHAIVTFRTCVTTLAIAIGAGKLYICTIGVANLPASRTFTVALQPGHRLEEASCEKQGKGYRECFHRGATGIFGLGFLSSGDFQGTHDFVWLLVCRLVYYSPLL